jgi:hypothetical protein
MTALALNDEVDVVKGKWRNSATSKFYARKDCEDHNLEYRQLYTDQQISNALAFHEKVASAFFRRRVFLNYRQNFITVKVEKPMSIDKFSEEYFNVLDYAIQRNYKIKQGYNSIIFEIK